MNKTALKAKITSALRKGIRGSKATFSALIPPSLTAGKMYEAYVLGLVCQRLRISEGMTITLVGSNRVALKSSPGPINLSYPHLRVTKDSTHIANIWTDIEFTALSAVISGTSTPSNGEYHEADIAMVTVDCASRPTPEEVYLVVECKNTGYQKSLLREILGVRRELSFVVEPKSTRFNTWPASEVRAHPPSCVCVYSTDPNVASYSAPGTFFGVNFYYEPL